MILTREQAKEYIKRNLSCRNYLKKAKTGGYCCIYCGSGTRKGSGAVKYYDETNTCACFACPDAGKKGRPFDVLDLIQYEYGYDYNAALAEGARQLNITIDNESEEERQRKDKIEKGYQEYKKIKAPAAEMTTQKAQEGPQKETDDKTPTEGTEGRETANTKPAEAPDLTEYYKECADRITDEIAVTYLQGRGISLETAQNNFLGFDPAADPAGKGYKAPRIIIPVTKSHYIGRAMDPAEQYQKINNAGSKPGIFNGRKVYESNPVFVTEGVFDALSVEEVGSRAIALNSTSNAELLLKNLEKKRTKNTLVLCLDNDDAGQKATERLKEGLERLKVSFITGNIAGKHKDANEALQADRERFTRAVNAIKLKIQCPDNMKDYLAGAFFEDVEVMRQTGKIKTGFKYLDELSKGVRPRLYIIAALSSLGKTTFALQAADNIAAAGYDVLFFSLEQSKLELVSKSLARLSKLSYDIKPPLESDQFSNWTIPKYMQPMLEKYIRQEGEHMNIIEGNMDFTISSIGERIRNHIEWTGRKPVVFVDYLQVIQPDAKDNRGTTKEIVDITVKELKRYSVDYEVPIFALCSVNRNNYQTPIDMESIKESGNIEFTADTIYGLQFDCINEALFSQEKKAVQKRNRIKQARRENPREIELVCLKNRGGRSLWTTNFKYYTNSDLFVNVKKKERPEPEPEPVPEEIEEELEEAQWI